MTISELSRDTANVLARSEIDDILFSLGGLNITPQGLRRVKRAIENGRIRVVLRGALKKEQFKGRPMFGRRTGALYLATPNWIVLRDVSQPITQWGQSCIVHEAVHALVDMSRASGTTALTNEVAAYLAQVIFLDAVNYPSQDTRREFGDAYTFARDNHLFGHKTAAPQFTARQYSHLRRVLSSNLGIADNVMSQADGV